MDVTSRAPPALGPLCAPLTAKMGQRTESLALLKAFNLLQALVASAVSGRPA